MLLINDWNPSANFLQALNCETFHITGSKQNSLQDIIQNEQKNIDAYMWQHHQDEYKALENYLIDYLNRKL